MQAASSYPCCGHPELSVLFSGEISNISDSQIASWLPSISSIPFCHIVKKTENKFGHVHFINQENTNRFYHLAIGERYEFSSGIIVKFFASKHFDTKRKVVYGRPLQQQQKLRQQQQLLYPYVQQPQQKQRQPQPVKQQRRLHQQLLQPYIQLPQQQPQRQRQQRLQQRLQQRDQHQHQQTLQSFLQRQQQQTIAQQLQTVTTVLECDKASNEGFTDQFDQ